MKPSRVFLALSLVANVALAAVYWWPHEAGPPAAGTGAAVAAAKPKVQSKEEEIAAALRGDPEFAEAMKSGDAKRMREALLRAGFPEDYARDMVTFFTGNTVSPDNLALLRRKANRAFWKVSPDGEELALEKRLRERDTAAAAANKEAFGGKTPPHPLEAQNQQRRYRFLPEEKIAAVAKIDADYAEATMAAMRDRTPEGREKERQLRADMRAELVKTLTPAELDLYDLNLSGTANSMRQGMALFQPTEAEFKAVFAVRKAFDDKYTSAFGRQEPAQMQQQAADQEAMNNQVRALLGDARYGEYMRSQDSAYQAATEIASHFALPASAAMEVYTLQQSYMSRAVAVLNGAGVDQATKAAQAAALLAEGRAQFTQILGAAGADAFAKTGGRGWMTQLERAAGGPRR